MKLFFSLSNSLLFFFFLQERSRCVYGDNCQFAHGRRELREVVRNTKYKTKPCQKYWITGYCVYGPRYAKWLLAAVTFAYNVFFFWGGRVQVQLHARREGSAAAAGLRQHLKERKKKRKTSFDDPGQRSCCQNCQDFTYYMDLSGALRRIIVLISFDDLSLMPGND